MSEPSDKHKNRVLLTVLGIPIRISPWDKLSQTLTMGAAIVALISCGLLLIFHINIPGLAPISTAIAILGLGIRSFNRYLDTNNSSEFFFGGLMVVLFVVDLYSGIIQIVNAVGK